MESVFSPYNTQIIFATLACLVSIMTAVYPEQVRLSRKSKICLVLLPLILNAVHGLIIVIDIYLNGINQAGVQWKDQPVVQFFQNTDLLPFGRYLLIVSALAMLFMYILIAVKKRTNFNDKGLMRYYVKLTEEQREGGPIIIIGGSMDFLGKCPCSKADVSKNKACVNFFEGKKGRLKRIFSEAKCKECCINNEQWNQLTWLVKRGCSIQIICAHPKNLTNETQAKELLGFLLNTWKKSRKRTNVQVFFFEAEKDPNIRGRIIEDFNQIKKVCWNFKNTNRKQNSYEMPFTYSQNDRMGALIIRAFDDIQKEATKITDAEENEYIKAYETYVNNDKQKEDQLCQQKKKSK